MIKNLFYKTYTTPAGDILTPTPAANNPDIIPGYIFIDILKAFNIAADCISIINSPAIITYNFFIPDIKDFNINKIKKAADAIQARYNIPAMVTTSGAGDFSIQLSKIYKDPLYLHSGIYSRAFNNSTRSTAAIGRDTLNNPVLLDIAAAPHVLIAGTTGSGKSVLFNSLICSLLYKETPASAKMIFIDPKQVEFSNYKTLRHLYAPIITDTGAAVETLKNICDIMDARYKKLSKKGLKNINGSNYKRIYIFIDELADLMLTSGKNAEKYIIRIAQLGRAAGIHLIIATQRPTRDVITGLIKSNIPCKIALTVSSVNDSITILGHGGAEKLTGCGDFIIKYPDKIQETRAQAYYTPDKDIIEIVKHYK